MLLSELKTGESAVITKVKGYGAFRKRLNEMGFVRGKVVKAVKNAPLNVLQTYKIKEIYIPYYLCDVMRHVAFEAKCKPIFYNIDDNFFPLQNFPKNLFYILTILGFVIKMLKN